MTPYMQAVEAQVRRFLCTRNDVMQQHTMGRWVAYQDFDALRQQLEAAQARVRETEDRFRNAVHVVATLVNDYRINPDSMELIRRMIPSYDAIDAALKDQPHD